VARLTIGLRTKSVTDEIGSITQPWRALLKRR
jgi:hypothetical protein